MKKLTCLFLLGLGFPGLLLADLSLPAPTGYVNDFANVIPQVQAQEIEGFLTELDQKTGSQITVVTVDSLNGEDIDTAKEELFKAWGIGQKKKDNGVLILAAMKDQKIGIEVGYGVEPILPDGKAGTIIRQDMIPAFKQGDYGSGLMTGSLAVAQVIAEDAGVTLTGQASDLPTADNQNPYGHFAFWAFILLFLFIFSILSAASRGRRGGGFWGGGYWGGGGFGGGSFGGGGGGFGGFGGGGSGGGGASGGW